MTDKKKPPHEAGASLPSRGGREEEELDPGATYIDEDGHERDTMGDRVYDDDGWPIVGSGGPVRGMRPGDTWHRKK